MQCHARDEAADRHCGVMGLFPAARPRQRHDLVLGVGGDLREGGVDDLAAGADPLPDRDIKVFDARAVEDFQHRFERALGKLLAVLAIGLLQDSAAEIEVLGALLGADKAPDARPSLAGDDKTLPIRRRGLRLGRNDLDLVSIGQLAPQRQQAPVDLGADAAVADLRVDRIGKVDRGRAARQSDQVALRRKGEDLVGEHLEPRVLEKFLRSRRVVEDLQQFAHPAVLPPLGLARALLVAPMRGDAELGDLVHVARADLHLDALPLRPDHPGMQRAVVIGLRRRDIVFEAAGDDVIGRVDRAQRVIALADIVDQDAEGHHVGELLERDVALLHLAPDRIGRFLAAHDGRRRARRPSAWRPARAMIRGTTPTPLSRRKSSRAAMLARASGYSSEKARSSSSSFIRCMPMRSASGA